MKRSRLGPGKKALGRGSTFNPATATRTSRKAPRRWKAALGARCLHPSCPERGTPLLQLHHVTLAQHVRRERGDEFDPRNAMTLCATCHASHHARIRRIPLAAVPGPALEFAFELLGAGAYDYLKRHYQGRDERLEWWRHTWCKQAQREEQQCPQEPK